MSNAIRSILLIGLSVMAVAACGDDELAGDGDIVTETRTVDDFTAARADNGARLTLDVDPAVTTEGVDLDVTTDSNLLEFVTTEVPGDELRVSIDRDGGITPTHGAEVTGIVAVITEVAADNGAHATITASMTDVSLSANNGAWIHGESLEAAMVSIDADNGGHIDVCVTGEVSGSVTNGAELTVLCGGDVGDVETSNGGKVASG